MIAAGAYLATLRSERGYTQLFVADKLKVDIKSVQNWERGKKEPASFSLAGFVSLVGGNPKDVHDLMLDAQANEESGRKKAHDWLRRDPELTNEIDQLLTGIDPLVVRDLLGELSEEYGHDPSVIDRLRGWLDGWRSHRKRG